MRRILIAALLCVSLFLPYAAPVKAYYEGFTHAVYVESVVGTWCPYCQGELSQVHSAAQKYAGSLHLVDFHVAFPSQGRNDEYATDYGTEKVAEYHVTGTPTHAHDAGYLIQTGFLNFEANIESTGKRPVHRVTLAVLRRIQGSVLSFEGSVKEEDGRSFNGKIMVVATENGLPGASYIWNSVFRAYLLKQDVNLAAGQYSLFSGTWSIPSGVTIANVQLVVAAFDSTDQADSRGPFAIQSVSDADSGAVIPEFNVAIVVAGVAIAASMLTLRFSRSKILRYAR